METSSRGKIISLSRVAPVEELDSVKVQKKFGDKRAFQVLFEAQRAWDGMEQFRRDRERNKRYTYGAQWDDLIKVDGKVMSEEDYIKSQGNVPLKNNVIRRLVRAILGAYRSQSKEPTCTARDRDEQRIGETMSVILQYNMQMNRMQEMYARTMEEFLIGGFVVHRKWFGWRRDKYDCWTDIVQPNNFFIDANMRDTRGWDVSLLGEVHDISFETLCSQFAESPEDFRKLKEIYSLAHNSRYLSDNCERFGYRRLRNYDFLLTNDPSRCRVIEVWKKESKPRYRCHDYSNGDLYKVDEADYEEMVEDVNQERIRRGLDAGMSKDDIPLIKSEWFMDDYWYFYYLTPFGDILKEGETPYMHNSHPYVFKAYPFIDGEIHSFVADVIDQQRYINRLITLNDWIMRASAKGLLLFPEDCIPDNVDIDDIADEWSRFNGVIAIKKGAHQLPQQISNNATNIGTSELLNMQLKLIEDISGVHGAMQGKPGYSGVSGALYAQQTQNATTSLLDLLDSFSMFVIDAAYKDVKNMQQCYDSKRIFNIAGKAGAQIEYDPQKINDVEFDLSVVESPTTPAYRQIANEFLMEIWRANQISLQQLLEYGDFPFADGLLQNIQSQQEQMQQGQTPQGVPQQLQQQAQQGADMDAVNKAYGMITGAGS